LRDERVVRIAVSSRRVRRAAPRRWMSRRLSKTSRPAIKRRSTWPFTF